jgi:hypothetical protein
MGTAIGYYKVFATEGQEIRDWQSWTPFRPGGVLVQWIYPFTDATRNAMRDAAMLKASDVSARLDGAPVSGIKKIRGPSGHAYAIRVGKERIEA